VVNINTDSSVTGNRAAGDGGGLFVNNGIVTIDDARIGAVGAGNIADNLDATDADDAGNGGDGGGIFVAAGTVTISNGTTIESNSADNGGGINVAGGTVTVGGSTVGGATAASANSAAQDGGGVHLAGGALSFAGTTSTIRFNTAGRDGGGINVASTYTNALILTNLVSIQDNSASRNGGGVHLAGGTSATWTTPALQRNHADSGRGGAIYVASTFGAAQTLALDGTTVGGTGNANTATDGGGIAWESLGTLQLQGATVSFNTATGDGGGIFVSSGAVNITGGAISSNIADNGDANDADDAGNGGDGGGLFVAGGNVAITSGTVQANSADNGGGIAFAGAGTLSIDSGTVTDNSAALNGGGIDISAGVGHSIASSTIADNTATAGNGGGINVAGAFAGTLTISASTIGDPSTALDPVSNRAVNGGGLAVGAATGTVNLLNTTISGNAATNHGGGIHHTAGAVTLAHVTMTLNNADSDDSGAGDGGGVFTSAGASITAINTIFAQNSDLSGVDQFNNIAGALTSLGNNLVGRTTGFTPLAADIVLDDGDDDVNDDGIVSDLDDRNGDGRIDDIDREFEVDNNGARADDLFAFLAPLANYGGPTLTHALLPGSPALDAAAGAQAVDQRGTPRAATRDIGAFESGGFVVTVLDPNDVADKFRALIKHTFVEEVGLNDCDPRVFMVTVEANDPAEPIQGGRVELTSFATRFLADNDAAGVPGTLDVFLAIGAPDPLTNEATVSTATAPGNPIKANQFESTAFTSYDLKATAGGANVSADEWEMFNQKVEKIVPNGQPQTTRSGDVIRFASGLNTEVGLVYTLFDQEVTAANEAASIVKFNNELPTDQLTLDPIKFVDVALQNAVDAASTTIQVNKNANLLAVGMVITIDAEQMRIDAISGNTLTVQRGQGGTLPAPHAAGTVILAPLPDAAIFNLATGATLAGGNATVPTNDCGEADFSDVDLKIYQSTFNRLYRLQASFTNPDNTPPGDTPPVTVLSEPFRILPRSLNIVRQTRRRPPPPPFTSLVFFSTRRQAPIVRIVNTSRGAVRVVQTLAAVQRRGEANQIVVHAFDAVNETGAVALATAWDGPIDVTIPRNGNPASRDEVGRWDLTAPQPNSSPRVFLNLPGLRRRIVRATAAGGVVVIKGISPTDDLGSFFVRSKLTLNAQVLEFGAAIRPNETVESTAGPFTRVVESRHRRK
jgi:hypothetical protein